MNISVTVLLHPVKSSVFFVIVEGGQVGLSPTFPEPKSSPRGLRRLEGYERHDENTRSRRARAPPWRHPFLAGRPVLRRSSFQLLRLGPDPVRPRPSLGAPEKRKKVAGGWHLRVARKLSPHHSNHCTSVRARAGAQATKPPRARAQPSPRPRPARRAGSGSAAAAGYSDGLHIRQPGGARRRARRPPQPRRRLPPRRHGARRLRARAPALAPRPRPAPHRAPHCCARRRPRLLDLQARHGRVQAARAEQEALGGGMRRRPDGVNYCLPFMFCILCLFISMVSNVKCSRGKAHQRTEDRDPVSSSDLFRCWSQK